jgi:hypothetical protein
MTGGRATPGAVPLLAASKDTMPRLLWGYGFTTDSCVVGTKFAYEGGLKGREDVMKGRERLLEVARDREINPA